MRRKMKNQRHKEKESVVVLETSDKKGIYHNLKECKRLDKEVATC